jgi:AcrR family transcriptional regulator
MAPAAADPTIHRQVVAAARDLLRRTPDAPISHIAERAGVSRATFYRHFGSRERLLEAVEIEPPASARERILETAADLIGQRTLSGLSMDELAVAAGVSRATVYRLFPSKANLFGEIVRTYSPFEPAVAVIREHGDRPLEVVVPLMVRTIAAVAASRIGIMRGLLLETSSLAPDAISGVRPFMPEALGAIAAYFARQMAAGRMRRMHPILAVQAVLGPVFFHLLTRPIAEELIAFEMPVDEAVEELAATILEGIAA